MWEETSAHHCFVSFSARTNEGLDFSVGKMTMRVELVADDAGDPRNRSTQCLIKIKKFSSIVGFFFLPCFSFTFFGIIYIEIFNCYSIYKYIHT